MKALVTRYVTFLSRRRGYLIVLLLAAAVTALSFLAASGLRVRPDLALLLPAHAPAIIELRRALDRLGTTGEVVVEIRSSDPAANLRFMEAAAPALEALPEVNFVLYHQDPRFFEDNALLYLSVDRLKEIEGKVRRRIQEEVGRRMDLLGEGERGTAAGEGSADGGADAATRGNRGGSERAEEDAFLDAMERRPWTGYRIDEYFLGEEGRVALMQVQPNGPSTDVDFARRLVAGIEGVLRNLRPESFAPDLRFELHGDYTNTLDEVESIKKAINVASVLCTLVLFVCIYAFFRQLRAPFLVLVPLFLSTVWTLAVAYFAFGTLNVVSGFVVAILLGLGEDIGDHMWCRYLDERREGRGIEESLAIVLERTGRSTFTAALTSALTFFTLVFADFRGFYEFGFISAVGILFCYLAMVTVFPALVLLFEKVRPVRVQPLPLSVTRKHILRRRGPIVALSALVGIGALVAIYGAAVLPKIPFEFDFGKLTRWSAGRQERQVAEARVHQEGHKTYRDILDDATFPNAVAFVDSLEEARSLHKALEGVRKLTDPKTGRAYLTRFLTIWHFVPDDQEAKLAIIARIRRMVERKIDLFEGEERARVERLARYLKVDRPFGPDDLPGWVKKRFTERDGKHFGRFAMLWGWGHKEDYRTAARLYEVFGRVRIEGGKEVPVAANYFILKDVVDMAARDGRKAVLLAAAAVLLILIADFRSARKVALAFGTLLIGFFWLVAVLHLVGVTWSFFNLAILPVVIGMGIAFPIHILHRHEEEGRGGVLKVLRNQGGALVLTTFTTGAGFFGMLLANHYGLNSLGAVACIGLATALGASLTVLPAYLMVEDSLMASRAGARAAEVPHGE